MEIDFDFDPREFMRSLDWADARVRAGAIKGMQDAMNQLLSDAIQFAPATPIKTGNLRSTGGAYVNGDIVGKGPDGPGKPSPDDPEGAALAKDGVTIAGAVAYNAPYAARLHENPQYKFTNEDDDDVHTGGKYLSMKLDDNEEEYWKLVALGVKSELGS